MSFEEKRISPRESIKHPVKFRPQGIETWSIAYLIDQSATGILLAAQHPAEINSVIDVVMDSDTSWSGEACELSCEVVRIIEQPEDALLKYDLGCIIKSKKAI